MSTDELGLAEALDAAAGQIDPSADAWATNVIRVRRRRHATQAAALLGAVVIAGGTLGGLALARGTGAPTRPATTQSSTPFSLTAGPYALTQYTLNGRLLTYYAALGHQPGKPLSIFTGTASGGRIDWDGWSYTPTADDNVVGPVTFQLSPRPQGPYVAIGLVRSNTAQLTLVVKDQTTGKTHRVPARIFGPDHGVGVELFSAPFFPRMEQIVAYTGKYTSGKPFTYNVN